MAFIEFGSADAQTVKRWSESQFVETLGKMGLRGLVGKKPTDAIQLLTDLNKAPGDTIYVDLRAQDRGTGTNGDTTLEGYEDALTYYQDTLKINLKRKAHAFKGMTQQRTIHDLRAAGRDSLSTWFAWFIEAGIFAHLAGVSGDGNESVLNALGATTAQADFAGNTITALDSAHLADAGGSSLTLDKFDDAVAKAKVNNPRVAPLMVDGEERYIAYLHPYQVRALRSSAGTSWSLFQRDAAERGASNPIFTGALGIYNGVILRESEFIPSVGNVRHGVMLGQGAGMIAFGNAWESFTKGGVGEGSYFDIREQEKDFGNQKAMAAISCLGFKRAQFNSAAFGVIGIRSTETAPS